VQRVDGEPGVAVVPVGDGGRADVGPGPGGDVVAPDLAGPAVFLASDESSWISGTNIVVDGGGSVLG